MRTSVRLPLAGMLMLMLCFFSACKNEKEDDNRYSGPLFNENIRTTDPRTPEEERLGFKLPPGFEIQLFASEPDIDKPMNMAFDAKGRMWVTQSFEYPFPSPAGKKSTDKLTILEDTDHDGKADRFTHVADTLNIPIGVLPLTDGVISFSVPNLYKFTDADGDGKPESNKIMFGPFGYQDTHGMVSNLIRGYDGWVHACHGFTNFSKVAGTDGDSITMVSGNTFRFRLDGSRAEQMTFGQVNPFGLAYDENGYIYSTDSHSSPLYQLIQGGDYPHFNKLEIMAFGPDMKSLENEATALCGIAYYGDTKFPKEFQGNFFIGDAFLSKVHRYTWINNGSSPRGKSEVDFVQSADPWFRPVNVKLGPDGALYVADFYNAIIGHYEVPLGHPKRDKQRGRIWRITYKGEHNNVEDLTKASIEDLFAVFDADNITTRMLAADQLVDRVGEPATASAKAALENAATTARRYIHSLWVLYRLNGLTDDILKKSLTHTSPLIRLHALRVLREWKPGAEDFHQLVSNALTDSDPHVKRAAVELLMSYRVKSSVDAILSVLHTAPAHDTHLVYTSRLCLRNLLRDKALMKQVNATEWSEQDAGFIAGTLVDVASADAAQFLSRYLKTHTMGAKTDLAYQQIMRFIPDGELAGILKEAREKKSDVDLNAKVFKGIRDGLAQRGDNQNKNAKLLEPWGTEVAEGILKKYPSGYSPITEDVTMLQTLAIQLAGDYKVQSLGSALTAFLESKSANVDVKATALRSILKLSHDNSALELAEKILTSDTTRNDFKKRVVSALSEMPGTETFKVLTSVKKAPADLEAAIATALASTPEGKELVFQQVKDGAFGARTLVDPRVEERLLLNISPKQQKVYDDLTANIEPISAERQALIDERLRAFKTFKASSIQLDSGAMIFGNNCGVCHRKTVLSGIGPQLHGIGKRGADALAEKILDPNRNISEAFRNYTIKLKDGKVMTGLYRREQGAVVVFGDLTGKEFSVAKKEIAEQKPSRYTIMPDHFGTTLSQHEFDLLLTYLLTW